MPFSTFRLPPAQPTLYSKLDKIDAELLKGEFVVGPTTFEDYGFGKTYRTPTGAYVYLDEGGMYDGELKLEFHTLIKFDIKSQLSGRIYLGFPRDKKLEVPFVSSHPR